MDRIIFHVDVNSAFLSWEATRRVKNGLSDIRLIPSAIGGDREKRTGIILAKSIPAKKYDIKTGEPVGMALRKCPNLFLVKPDFKLYEHYSKAFINICKEYSPVVEQFSIDECFIDMSGMELIYKDPIKVAYTIKNRIRDELGFTVNIGIGNNMLLAKMASDFEKPDKVHTLFENEIQEKMWPLDVNDLLFLGKQSAEKLKQAGINTIGQLASTPLKRVQLLIGEKMGKQLLDYANGIDDSKVLEKPNEAKGYSIATTLEEDIATQKEAIKILKVLCEEVTARMRNDKVYANVVSVTIRDNLFNNKSHQKKMTFPSDITKEIEEYIIALFNELWDKHTPIRLLGVALMDVTKEKVEQISLFEENDFTKDQKIDKALDEARKKFGSDTVIRGTSYSSNLNVGKKYKAQMDENNN